MPDAAGMGILRLMAWLSPAFPVGSFAYSHGIERAVQDGRIADRESTEGWLRLLLSNGSGWNDAVLFAQAWRYSAAGHDLHPLAELAEALAASDERRRESLSQGEAFCAASTAWAPGIELPRDCPYAVAVGALAGAHGIPLRTALAAFLQAFVSNLLQATIRLGVTGQSGALETLAALEPHIVGVAMRAENADLDDLGTATLMSDISAMRHETQYSRLFRT